MKLKISFETNNVISKKHAIVFIHQSDSSFKWLIYSPLKIDAASFEM